MMVGDVGDVLLATPALRRLRATYPHAHITAMTKPATIAVLVRSGLVNDFMPVEKHLFDRPSALLRPAVTLGLVRFVRRLRQRRFDTVILFQHLVTWWGTLKFSLLSLATGAPLRAGLDNGRGFFLTHAARDQGFDAAHESEYWLRVVAALNPLTPDPVGEGLPIFVVPDEARQVAGALLREAGVPLGEPLLALHPGSGTYSTARRWFPERFAAVADDLAARHGLRVALLGNAEEHALAEQVIGYMRAPAFNLAGRTSLDGLGAVLQRCALLIGNDAGVAHLASAVGTPVVAIFGPFNHHTWHPLGRSLVVRADPALPCMPCVNRGFSRGYPEGCPPRYCLREVTPAMVLAAAEKLLAAREAPAQPRARQRNSVPAEPPA